MTEAELVNEIAVCVVFAEEMKEAILETAGRERDGLRLTRTVGPIWNQLPRKARRLPRSVLLPEFLQYFLRTKEMFLATFSPCLTTLPLFCMP